MKYVFNFSLKDYLAYGFYNDSNDYVLVLNSEVVGMTRDKRILERVKKHFKADITYLDNQRELIYAEER